MYAHVPAETDDQVGTKASSTSKQAAKLRQTQICQNTL
jgi:hypothetical protein